MAKYKRTVSLIDPPEKYRGPWVKEDFVKHCPHLFQGGPLFWMWDVALQI
jgi:hypothetical protein